MAIEKQKKEFISNVKKIKKLYKIKINRAGSEMNFDVKIPRKLKTANL